jgi:hypothetical protein
MTGPPRPAVHVYCGPTISAAEVRDIVPGAVVHPPVRHGDLLRLDVCPGDTVVIIDGVFHSVPAVRHKEILNLMADGVRVAGAASMGALRAAELHPYGMTGVGAIFAAYRDGVIDADDEVAVAHTDDDHRQLSEALADIRALAAQAVTDGVMDRGEADRIIEHARSVHYPGRTWAALRRSASADPGLAGPLQRLDGWRAAHPQAQSAKHADAVAVLRLAAAGDLPPADTGGWSTQPWRTFYLQHWIARYRGRAVDGIHVPFLAVLQHQQIYDPDFPRRWRRHVLSWIAGTASAPGPGCGPDPEGLALAAAAAKGLALRHLSPGQLAYWLTGDELAGLADPEKLARLLVRSVSQDTAAALWPAAASDAPGLLNPSIDSVGAASAAFRLNDQIARTGPGRTVHDLREPVLRDHLARQWDVSPDDGPALSAAARDRGFHAASGAAVAARLFLLSARHGTDAAGAAGRPGP